MDEGKAPRRTAPSSQTVLGVAEIPEMGKSILGRVAGRVTRVLPSGWPNPDTLRDALNGR